MDLRAKKILDFWFIETPAEKRFKKDEKFDQIIKEKFLSKYINLETRFKKKYNLFRCIILCYKYQTFFIFTEN